MKRRLSIAAAAVAVLLATAGVYRYLSRPQLVFLGFPGSYIALMMKASSQTGIPYEFWGRRQMEDPKLSEASLLRYKAVFVSGRRSEPFSDPLKRAILAAQNKGIRVIVLPPDQAKSLGVGNADFRGAEQPIERYFHYGGTDNMAGLFQYAAKTYVGKNVVPPPPVPTPEDGYYHPQAPRKFTRTSEYAAWYEQSGHANADAPRVLIDFADGWKLGSTAGTDAIIGAFEKKGWKAAAIFGRRNTAQFALEWKPDILLTRTHGRWYQGDRGVQLLASRLDVPLMRGLQLFFTGETLSDYRKTNAGIRGAGLAIGAIVPELDGAIEPTLLEGLDAEWYGKRYEAVLDDRIERLVDRSARWVRLRKVPNRKKKVAVIYVAGVGKGKVVAASLNVPASLTRFLGGLRDAGYSVTRLPTDPEALIQEMNTKGRNIAETQLGDMEELSRMAGVELLPAEEYKAWFEQLPEVMRKQVTDAFGPPPGRLMVVERDGKQFLLVPKLDFGNVIVLPQPARGGRYDSKLLHNDKIPPPHQFLAVYFWLEKKFKADAIVNYGTHGTHEFLPGRPVGQLSDDWSDLTLGRLPNVYVYIMDNIGEALIAKRRGSAVTVSHQTPPIVASSLQEADPPVGEIYRSAQQFATQDEGALKEKLRERIRDLAVAKKFDRDLNKDWSKVLPTDEEVQALELHIHLLDEDRIALGLHTHSKANTAEELAPVVTEVLGSAFQKKAGDRKRAIAMVRAMLDAPAAAASEPAPRHPHAAHPPIITKASGQERAHVAAPTWQKTAEAKPIPGADDNARVRVLKAGFAGTAREIPETLRALEGRYIRPGSGGDPVRNPMALPTGKNLYGINPQEVPTRAAWELGRKLAEDLIANEQKRLGRFPRKIGFTLWNTELIRHYGADLAQILYLMGLQPRWDQRGVVEGVDVIPMAQLKRPRIDVVIQAASLFRDTFPDRMEFLDQAVRVAAAARDGENYIAENNAANERQLKEAGVSARDARLLAGARVFSNAPGGYGTGVIDGIEKSGNYDNSKPITEDYLIKTGAVYTAGVEWGKFVPKLYEQQLKSTDAVALSRSSNVVSALTLDHYFEYLGGMTMAIRDTTGKSPETYVSDVRDASRATMLTAQQALRNDMRTKYWNPKWIAGQQKEGFSGAAEIAETTKNLFGWQVTKPEAIGDDVWDTVEQIYVEDSLKLGVREWFDQKNPYAYQSTTAILLESARKGYWKPGKEVLQRVANEYAQSVGRHGHAGDSRTTDNAAFQSFLNQQLNAPGNVTGIQLSKSYQQSLDKSSGVAGKVLVAGQRLAREAASRQTQTIVRYSTMSIATIAALATLFYFGLRRKNRS
ncbi:MAG: cobaltochelatase subunit CobN [Bryobacterales bacterium]|nr:cobaltochelatase subunit CobN [Bryobacterales bacterium]